MVVRGREFDDIYDLIGIRVLVNNVRDCYAVLGSIHARWTPLPGGVPLLVDGECVGALGVAGAPPEVDELVSAAGAAALRA